MRAGLVELFRTTLLIIGALFPIVNPLGNTPIFLSLTRDFGSAARRVLARKIALNGFVLLVVSIFIGTHILAFFGISIPVVQVGGGLVVIATGWSLLNREEDDEEEAASSAKRKHHVNFAERAFYPLTLPLTVGPGSISVAIAVGANRPERADGQWPIILAALIGSVLIAISIYLSYRFAERIARALGETAMKVLIRLSSFILVCIGVQILWNGVSALLNTLVAKH